MPYEVQHNTVADGWINMWRYPEADGVMRLEIFANAEQAQEALDEYLQDLEDELWLGYLPVNRDDFRVQYVSEPPTAEWPDAAGDVL